MGLDTSHDCFNGPYPQFHRWRTRIAEVSGYGELWPDHIMDMIDVAEDGDVVDGTWNKPPKDPILILLCHSDCSGSIAPDDAALLADRLEGLLPNLHGGYEGDYDDDFKALTETFIAGLRAAAAENESVDFH